MEFSRSYNIIQIFNQPLEDGEIEERRIFVNVLVEDVEDEEELNEGEGPTGLQVAAGVVGGSVVAGVGVPVAGTAVLTAAGFTGSGIAAGSLAAASQAAIGNVAAGSLFATLQSVGATGGLAILGPVGLAAAVVGGGTVAAGFGIRALIRRRRAQKNDNEGEENRDR